MRKLIIFCSSLFIMISLLSAAVFAAPEALYPDTPGNAGNLVTVTNPEGTSDITFDNSYVISGYGEVGTVVTIYSFNPTTGLYEKLYKTVTTVSEDGAYETAKQSVSCTIGDSTLFLNTVTLSSGSNSFMLYAENGSRLQITKFFIIKHNYNVIDVIRSWGVY